MILFESEIKHDVTTSSYGKWGNYWGIHSIYTDKDYIAGIKWITILTIAKLLDWYLYSS